jgi:hypothetical protein
MRTSAFEPCSTSADPAGVALPQQPAAHPRGQDLGGGAVHLRPLLVHLGTVRRVVAQRDGVLVLPRRERVVMRHGDVHRTIVKGGALPLDARVGLESTERVPVDGRAVQVGGQRGVRGSRGAPGLPGGVHRRSRARRLDRADHAERRAMLRPGEGVVDGGEGAGVEVGDAGGARVRLVNGGEVRQGGGDGAGMADDAVIADEEAASVVGEAAGLRQVGERICTARPRPRPLVHRGAAIDGARDGLGGQRVVIGAGRGDAPVAAHHLPIGGVAKRRVDPVAPPATAED